MVLFCHPFAKTVVEICVTAAIVIYFAKIIFIDKTFTVRISKWILIPLLLYCLFNFLSVINSAFLENSLKALVSKLLKWVLFFITVSGTVKEEKQFRMIFYTMLASIALILADGAYQQYVTGKDFLHYPNKYPVFKFEDRHHGFITFPTASFPYPNEFASWISVNLLIMATLLIFNIRNAFTFTFVFLEVAALSFFLLLTSVTSSILGAAAGFMALILRQIRKFLLPAAAVLAVCLAVIYSVPYLRAYFMDNMDYKLSLNDRIKMWGTGMTIYKRHPVLGNGINTFFELYKEYREDEDKNKRGSYAHNCAIQMAADIGVFGFLSFIMFCLANIYLGLKNAFKKQSAFMNAFQAGACFAMIAFLVNSFFDTNFYSLSTVPMFWLFMGIISSRGNE